MGFERKTFMINENCKAFLDECRNYAIDSQGRFSDPDDCIDSARYALLGCLNGWAEEWDNRSPGQRFKDAAHNMRVRKAQQGLAEIHSWKRPQSIE
jgi:hypothetical protein